MQIVIENPSGNAISIVGRVSLAVPANAVGEKAFRTKLPDNERTRRTLERLKAQNPALKIRISEDISAGRAAPASPAAPAGTSGTNKPSATEDAPLPYADLDAFAAAATVAFSKSGKTVTVTAPGLAESISFATDSADKQAATEEAFRRYGASQG